MHFEYPMYYRIGRFLRNRGWHVQYEVSPRPGSPRRFDVVGVKPRKHQVVVVEAKLGHYRRTFEQAADRHFVADFVYISFPLVYARTVLRDHARELHSTGIGLIGVDGKARELLAPRHSEYVDDDRRDQLIAMVQV